MSDNQLRVSLNKIAEFTYASSARKERIVKEQKIKKPFIAAGYREAEDFIPQFFGKKQDAQLLQQHLQNLTALHGFTPKDSLNNSINGLLALQTMTPIPFGNVEYHQLPRNSHDGIIVEDVFINVRPDVLLTKITKGITTMGAVKLHFPKSNPLGEKGGYCVAAVLLEYLSQLSAPLGTPKYGLCYSVDVQPNEVYVSPASYKRIMKDLEAACRQYKLLWNSIK